MHLLVITRWTSGIVEPHLGTTGWTSRAREIDQMGRLMSRLTFKDRVHLVVMTSRVVAISRERPLVVKVEVKRCRTAGQGQT